ncbi:MAG TPA: M48 family metallopeptidase [Terriglobales bacterium]|jgi:predicted Zn-dependent protease|nr:M48 family metallopeptidase [Terriglobales bacterium]
MVKINFKILATVILAVGCGVGTISAQTQGTQSPPAATASAPVPTTAPASTTEPADTPSEPSRKSEHEGGINDLDAIGNRKIGCDKGLGNWYSLEKQIAMGKAFSQQVESQSKLINDPMITEYVNRLGQNLVRNSDSQVPFTIKVIDSDEINAFALPGGFFYVNSGLILAADEEAELAGVMAHEIAHVAACHAARENTRGNLMNLASIPLIFIGGPIGYAGYEAAGLAVPLTFMKFSRGFEAEADYLGLEYMYKAGYDPQAFISFFEKVQAEEKKKPGTLSKAFATHPQTPDRIEKSQEEIAQILPARAEYKVTTSEFDDVKARLAAIENRHKVTDQKDGKKPSLRRASTTDKNGTDDKTGDDGRPTLKRRDDTN